MDKRILDIKKNLDNKTTEELLKIYSKNDTEIWSKSAFLAIKLILDERSALRANDPTYCHPKDVLCSKCGSNNFDYDKLWKEYVCVNCGLIVQDKEKLSSLTNNQSKQEDAESTVIEKREQVESINSQIPSTSSQSESESFSKKLKEGYNWETSRQFYTDYERSLTGKRDFWAWFYGLIVPVVVSIIIMNEVYQLKENPELQPLLKNFYLYAGNYLFFYLLISLAFFFGQTWARTTYYIIPIIQIIIFSFTIAVKLSLNAIATQIGRITGASIIPLIVYYIATNTVRNRLFFRLQVPEWRIREYWLKYSNKRANQSAWLALLLLAILIVWVIISIKYSEFLIPFLLRILLIIAVVPIIWLGNRARKEVNLNARPPINGKGKAIFSIITSSLWILFMLYSIICDALT